MDPEDANAGGEEGQAVDETVPELWKLAKPPAPADDDGSKPQGPQVGKLVKFLNDIEDQEEFETRIADRDPATSQSLLTWATLTQKFVLVEWLVKRGKRAAFAFSNGKKEITIADKWTEIRKELEEKEREKLLSPPEDTTAADEEDDEGKAPEPTAEQLVTDALGDLSEELGNRFQCIVKIIGELGVYQGARDEQGTKTGLGQTLFPNGDMYCGMYLDNQRHGQGTYYFAQDGMIYTGQWRNNLRHGVGRCVYPDGGRYLGLWVDDQRHGEGRYTYPDGSSYSGEWDHGVKHGNGSYSFTDGSSHVGAFVDGDFATGEWRLAGGLVRYVGSFKNGAPMGKGVYVFKSSKDQAQAYLQEGHYDASRQWIPGRIAPMDGTDGATVDINVQRRQLTATTTNESGTLNTEDLVKAVNFGPAMGWLNAVDQEGAYDVESLQIAGVKHNVASHDIEEVTLKLSVADRQTGRRVKDADRVTLREPVTSLVVLLNDGSKTMALVVQQPNCSLMSTDQLSFPRIQVSKGGRLSGEVIEWASAALRLQLSLENTTSLPIQLQSDLSVGSAPHGFCAYMQAVHPDTLASAQAKLDAAAPSASNGFTKLRLVRLEDVSRLSTDAASMVAASFVCRAIREGRLAKQTVDPQRPPTPIAPAPEPRPDIEPLVAAEKAKNAPKKDNEDE